MISKALFILFVASFVACRVESFSTGAGACTGGTAAVGGAHLVTGAKSWKLADKKIKVVIGNVTVSEGKTATVPTAKSLVIRVTGKQMAGILIRVQAPKGVSTKSVLSAGTTTQKAQVCASPVVGITHKSNTKRNAYRGKIKFNKETKGVIFDITVVFSNTYGSSEYAYGQVKADFVK